MAWLIWVNGLEEGDGEEAALVGAGMRGSQVGLGIATRMNMMAQLFPEAFLMAYARHPRLFCRGLGMSPVLVCLTEPPRIQDSAQPTEVTAAVGDPLELPCTVAGVPMPSLTWEKDGQPLTRSGFAPGNGSALRVDSVQVGAARLLPCISLLPCLGFQLSFPSLLAFLRRMMLACTPA